MPHLERETARARYEIDRSSREIRVIQRWHYIWEHTLGASGWTEEEKHTFHSDANRIISRKWNTTLIFTPDDGGSKTRYELEFAVGRSLETAKHWDVYATKIPRHAHITSEVDFSLGTIRIDTEDRKLINRCNDDNACLRQHSTIAHEFGHTIDNPDEYRATSTHLPDVHSIMNVGGFVRVRHFETTLDNLNDMVKDGSFAVDVFLDT